MENTYLKEQELTDRFGDMIFSLLRNYFNYTDYERVTDKERQVAGIDFILERKSPDNPNARVLKKECDLKFDFYDNENFVYELTQQYSGIGEKSWVEHNDNIWIAYYKLSQHKIYMIQLKTLKEWAESSEVFKNRLENVTNRKVDGKAGTFKNFRLSEIPWEYEIPANHLALYIKEPLKESWPDSELYKDNISKYFTFKEFSS